MLSTALLGCGPHEPPPIVYTLQARNPASHLLEVEALVPSQGREAIELRMAVWSPGYYRKEEYATRLRDFAARTEGGEPLAVESTAPNRWRVDTGGADRVVVSYRLLCEETSVTLNWVSPELAVINGPATFVTLVEEGPRPHEIVLELPPTWPRAATALEEVEVDGSTSYGAPQIRYRAPDFDTLADSPILAGDLAIQVFAIGESRFSVAHGGAFEGFPKKRAVADLGKMVSQTREFWGGLPFERYVFLNVHGPGGGGLEHKDSTLVTVDPQRFALPDGYDRWLGLTTHEFFHAWNVKRLRPVELGPFDYEEPPETPSLWISEGLTTYFSELILLRGGLRSPEEHLESLSGRIARLQSTPGRRVQTLEDSSRSVWATQRSGLVERQGTTISYYLKGPVVGFLLDAEIQRRTGGTRDLGDVLRWAFEQYSAERGFTAEEFQEAASGVAGEDLGPWLHRALATTEELDYQPALDWYGLHFVPAADGASEGKDPETEGEERSALEVRPDASEPQRRHLAAWLGEVG